MLCLYEDLYGRFIIRMTWGYRNDYPSYIFASISCWDRWLQQKESPMNEFTNLNDQPVAVATPLTDEQLAELLAHPAATVGFISTDDGDEVEEAKTIN